MNDHDDHTLGIGGCERCDAHATAIGYAVMGIDPPAPVPAGGNGGRVERSYLFDVGDSSDGPIGMCIRVTALTEEEAISRLRELLPESLDIDRNLNVSPWRVEYATIYFNAAADVHPDPDSTECTECEAAIAEDQDRCPYEHEHPQEA